jgi:hypothetical protein
MHLSHFLSSGQNSIQVSNTHPEVFCTHPEVLQTLHQSCLPPESSGLC